ncbi:MAG: hypothetical protein FWD27_00680 [Coriobacteriia bacterium]|nr:hypothetical protein [Coriobacteriia bacterium]
MVNRYTGPVAQGPVAPLPNVGNPLADPTLGGQAGTFNSAGIFVPNTSATAGKVGRVPGLNAPYPDQQTQTSSFGFSGGGGGGGGGAAAPSSFDLSLNNTVKIVTNDLKLPAALKPNATDEQKAQFWIASGDYWKKEAEAVGSQLNFEKIELARLEMQYPNFSMDKNQSQIILDQRAKVAGLETKFGEVKHKANTIDVSVGVSTTGDGDNVRVVKTYTITDDKGNTVSTQFSEDNGGMSASELRQKQQADQQKALNADNAAVSAKAQAEVTAMQSSAERDYAIGAAQSVLDGYMQQYNRNLQKIDQDYASDKLKNNQELLMSSNETASNAVKNSREANSILSQHNLGGSSLGGRLGQIASEAANNANQVTALAYNKAMREADSNYGDARMTLEDQRAQYTNQFNQSSAKAWADYWGKVGQQAGQNYEQMSIYANPNYWFGTMFDQQGNRLNSASNMSSQEMQSYAAKQAGTYQKQMDFWGNQQQQASDSQANTKADQYTSAYTLPAAKTYQTALDSYQPVNSNSVIQAPGSQPVLERKKEGEL